MSLREVFSIWRSLRCSTVHSAAGLVTISQCALQRQLGIRRISILGGRNCLRFMHMAHIVVFNLAHS